MKGAAINSEMCALAEVEYLLLDLGGKGLVVLDVGVWSQRMGTELSPWRHKMVPLLSPCFLLCGDDYVSGCPVKGIHETRKVQCHNSMGALEKEG